MIIADEDFEGTWPYAPNFFTGAGFRMHYIDENVSSDEVFLCVHGQPTWGYLYRNIIPTLKKMGRVVVADHMGFGKSETPTDARYTIEEHCNNLEALVIDLDLKNINLVLQDWGGPIGSSIAYRHPDRVKRLCIMNAVVGGRAEENNISQSPWSKWVASDAFLPTVSNLGATVLSVMKRIGFERAGDVTETWVKAYSDPFPNSQACIGAIRFPQCIFDRETIDFLKSIRTESAIRELKGKAAMYVHGEADRALPSEFTIGCFKDLWPQGPIVTLPGVGHFLQEDAPETVGALIELFVQTS